MESEDGRVQVTFNGEIYNWRELRSELVSNGQTFVSHSDTEVLLNGYQVWGDALMLRLHGMFAFAIWDDTKKTLILSRDRAGEKPLFYLPIPEGLVFASTLLALRPFLAEVPLDPVAIACHLSHSFIPASHTVWCGVKVLPPANTLKLCPGDVPHVMRYWDLPRLGPQTRPWRQCTAEVEAALDESVRRCLDADVPAGVFLSGGVDSSLIAALAARHQPDIKSFSLGFSEEEYSEIRFAKSVARHLEIPHETVTIDVDDVLDCLPHLVQQFGQPFGDASAVPTYLLAKFASRKVKVCLSGDGGDELFGGYWRVQSGVYAARYDRYVPRWVRQRLVPPLAGRLGSLGNRWMALNRLSFGDGGAGYNNAESWFQRLGEVAGPRLQDALSADLAALRVGKAAPRTEASVLQRLLYDDFQVQLPDAYLTKVDVASMAASLEVRAPFLEPTLMELAWTLPDRTKLSWGRRKVLLKQIAARYVPEGVIYRPKMGFGLPLSEWFRGRLGEYAEALFQCSRAVDEGYISGRIFQQTLNKHRTSGGEATRLWLLLWLELWFRAYRDDLVLSSAPEQNSALTQPYRLCP